MILRMKYPMLLLVTFALIVLQNGGAEALITYYFDTASNVIKPDEPDSSMSSGILKASLFTYPTPMSKTITLSAPRNCGIFASIRLLDLRPNRKDNITFLDITNPRNSVMYQNVLTYRSKFYDTSELLKTFDVPSGQLAITFQTSTGTSYGYDGFQIIYTTYSSKFSCGFAQFRCDNDKCIASFLKCDGHNHCGDGSDQWHCSSYDPSPRKVNVIGIVFGVVFLLIALASVIFIIVRRASRSRTEVQTVITHRPPTNLPSYPPTGTYPPPPPAYSQYSPGHTNPVYH